VRSVWYVSVAFPTVVLPVLVSAFSYFVASYVTHRRTRYHQRLEDAYSRFDQEGPAR
jgi:hypothetical protein